jgi:hypothetical protein
MLPVAAPPELSRDMPADLIAASPPLPVPTPSPERAYTKTEPDAGFSSELPK